VPYSRVSAAFLDFTAPRLPGVLRTAAGRGESTAIVVPLLLTAAYHGRVDVPAEIDRARAAGVPVDVGLAAVLGPVGGPLLDRHALDLMTSALIRRLDQTGVLADADGILLAGAGSRDGAALRTVDVVADALGTALERPCRTGYASGGGPGVAEAVAALRADGARRIAVASYFLAPGLLHDRVVGQALEAGVLAVAGPLGAAPEIARLVLARAEASRVAHPLAA
jgi:sirohydrochlorin ferrochelatase